MYIDASKLAELNKPFINRACNSATLESLSSLSMSFTLIVTCEKSTSTLAEPCSNVFINMSFRTHTSTYTIIGPLNSTGVRPSPTSLNE